MLEIFHLKIKQVVFTIDCRVELLIILILFSVSLQLESFGFEALLKVGNLECVLKDFRVINLQTA